MFACFVFRDDETDEAAQQAQPKQPDPSAFAGNPFLEVPYTANAVEYKKGYVMRKCCFDSNAKRSELHITYLFIHLILFCFPFCSLMLLALPVSFDICQNSRIFAVCNNSIS